MTLRRATRVRRRSTSRRSEHWAWPSEPRWGGRASGRPFFARGRSTARGRCDAGPGGVRGRGRRARGAGPAGDVPRQDRGGRSDGARAEGRLPDVGVERRPHGRPGDQAAAIQTVLDDFPMRAAPGWVDGLLIVLLGGVGALATAQLGPARGTAIGLAVALLFAGAAQLMFGAGLIVAVLAPLAALVLAVVGAVGVAAAVHGFDRERVRELFSRVVPEPSSTRSSSAPTRTFASAANGASSPSCSATSAASRATARTARPRRSSESSTAT